MKENRFFKRLAAGLLTGALILPAALSAAPQEQVSAKEPSAVRNIRAGSNDGYISKTVVVDSFPESSRQTELSVSRKGSSYYRDPLESYNSYFYYNQLSENEKKLYDYFNEQCLKYLTGTDDIKDKLVQGKDTYYYMPTISTIGLGLTADQVDRVAKLFHFENPQYFFLNAGKVSSSSGSDVALCVYPAFIKGTDRKTAFNDIMSTVNSWDASISSKSSAEEKVRTIHDLVIERVTYNTELYNSDFANDDNEYSQSMYSALGWSGRKSVCAGYSMAVAFLCNKYGIDCVSVTSEGHQWNLVRIDDQWYVLDATWDDQDSRQGYSVIYAYYLRSLSKTEETDRQLSGSVEHVSESFYNGLLPECVMDSGSKLESAGTLPSVTEKCASPTVTLQDKSVTISAGTGFIVYYTLDGAEPDPAFSKSVKYTGAFNAANGAMVRAVAVRAGSLDSDVATANVSGAAPAVDTGSTVSTGDDPGVTEEADVEAPGRPSIKSVKSTSKKKVKVNWSLVEEADGYEILCKAAGTTKKVKVSDTYAVSKLIKNLKSKKTYKIKVRAFAKSDDGTMYSGWSNAKKVKVK